LIDVRGTIEVRFSEIELDDIHTTINAALDIVSKLKGVFCSERRHATCKKPHDSPNPF
jgi:hypothetical protein